MSLTELPEEVLLQVLGSLDTLDLVACSLVCRRLRRVCEDELLWRLLLERGDQTWKVAEGFRRPSLPPLPPSGAANSNSGGSSNSDSNGVGSTNTNTGVDGHSHSHSHSHSHAGHGAASGEGAKEVCLRQTKASLELGRDPRDPRDPRNPRDPRDPRNPREGPNRDPPSRTKWWSHITRRLPQLWRPSHAPERKRILMVGMSKSKLVYQLMWDPHTPLKMLGLEPGYESGVGSGIKFQLHDKEFSLISVHSLQSIRQNVQLWGEFFSGANGLIVVLDCDQSTMNAFHSELDAVYDCVRKNTPILHIAKTVDQKMTAPKISKELRLYSFNFSWRLYTYNDQVETVASLKWGLSWLVKSMYEV